MWTSFNNLWLLPIFLVYALKLYICTLILQEFANFMISLHHISSIEFQRRMEYKKLYLFDPFSTSEHCTFNGLKLTPTEIYYRKYLNVQISKNLWCKTMYHVIHLFAFR